MLRVLFCSCAFPLMLCGCGRPDPVDEKQARAAEALPEVNAPAPTATGEPHSATTPAQPLPAPSIAIPAALHGRWGLSPADCMTRDGKGLLVISPDGLVFHVSKAVPATDVDSDSRSIVGNFAFTGEGRSWTKYEALKIDNRTLVRTEMNPAASFTYAKCS